MREGQTWGLQESPLGNTGEGRKPTRKDSERGRGLSVSVVMGRAKKVKRHPKVRLRVRSHVGEAACD